MPIRKAALEGSKEIFFAVISTSLTLAVVFLPVIFLEGFVGRLFREFGIVVAGAVLISAFVSLTITPVLNVYLTRKKAGHGWLYDKTEPFFTGMESGYKRILQGFMRVRWVAWVIVVACGLLIYFAGMNLQSEIAPMEDKSNVRFTISTPEGSSYQYTQNVSDQVTNFLNDSIPEKEFVFNAVPGFGGSGGTNSSIARIGLVSAEDRIRTQDEIAKMLNKKMGKFNNARVFGIQEQTISVGLGSRGSLPVQFVIQNIDFAKIKDAIPKFLEAARNDKTFQNVDVNLKFNKPEILMTFDRIKIKDLALTTQDVVSAVQGAFSGRRLAYFTMNGRQYEVIAQVERKERSQPTDINNLFVTNSRGERIPLSAVVKLEESSTPPSLYHFNRLKAATISASLAEGKTIGDGVKSMQAIADKVLDKTFQTALSGPSRDYSESSSNTAFAFGLALALIYLLLAAQFESFKDPFTIMITVPLALAGALGSLWIFGQTLNIFSQIGMIMLIGLVTKNGILIVEFANQKRQEGFSRIDAVVEASAQRLRPILMTSLATSLGALPIALSLGAASTSRVPLGTVVVGGILFSLILTLLVIPAVYTYFSSKNYITEESKLAKEEEEDAAHLETN
jgi:HAE1 family hydrophobic/amphiphilic exporter-1/multidrug efflux pump